MARPGPSALRTLVEHAYRPRESLAVWLDSLVEQTASLFSTELGAVGRLWDSDHHATIGDYAIHVQCARIAHAFARHREHSAHRIDFLRERSNGRPCSTRRVIERGGRTDDYLNRMLQSFDQAGVHDMLQVTSSDDEGLWLTLGVVQDTPRPLVGTAESWTKVRRHLTAALRAQHHFDALRARFDGGGRDVHQRLREALREIDAGSAGLGADEAATLWCELVRGDWRSLDQFDHEGRRYYLLAPKAREEPDQKQLTSSEIELATFVASGRSMKWMALTLGVARSTVNARLKTVLAKLGQRSCLHLVQAFRVEDDCAIPALSLRAHALGSRRYLLAFDLARSSSEDWTCHPSLSSAQRRVVHMALQGLSDRAIAQRLELSPHTVSHHLRRAYARLGVGSRAELFADLGRRPE